MEYNKNRFQKANDKKILHKVKKQWVVLSVALLAAIGGGVSLTTHAQANADSTNGQNNNPSATIKNRINQNLKLAQTQNTNHTQGQNQQVSSVDSQSIVKQASALHNQILGNAANANQTVNGRQQSNGAQSQSQSRVASAASMSAPGSVSASAASSASVQPRHLLGGRRVLLGDDSTNYDYYVPIRRIFENANGTAQQKYDNRAGSFVANSDKVDVQLSGGQNSSVTVGSSAAAYDQGYSALDSKLQPSGYHLADVNNSSVNSNTNLTANINASGQWSWSGVAGSGTTMPILTYEANDGTGADIDVRYINQNGYQVSASANGVNGASNVTSGSSAGAVQYSGAGRYGDAINVIAGLSSANSSAYNSYYDYGFSNGDTNPSYSDYTVGDSEQTVTLPIHGASYSGSALTVKTNIYNHKSSEVSSSSITLNFKSDHYGDLVTISPSSSQFTGGKDLTTTASDYKVDSVNANSGQITYTDGQGHSHTISGSVPVVYLSQNGPKWISLTNRSDATPTSISDNTITFNYDYGDQMGTAAPIHVTYRDQNNNVVSQGMITPSDSNYGDQIDIPKGSDVTQPGNTKITFGSGATLPKGYSLDYNKNDANGYDHYNVNSDYNSTSYVNYTPGTATQTSTTGFSGNKLDNNNAAGQDLTIYVDGNYQSTNNNNQNNLRATIKEASDGSVKVLGTIPLNLHGFAGNSEIISASDFRNEAEDSSYKNNSNLSNNIANTDTLTPSDKPYKVTFNGNGTVSVQRITGSTYHSDTKQMTYTTSDKTNLNPTGTNPSNSSDGIVFSFSKHSNRVALHHYHVSYFYSDASDVPNKNTPLAQKHGTSDKPLIPLYQTSVDDDTSSDFDLNSYMKNPPKGYQFVKVLSDSANGQSSSITGLKPGSNTTVPLKQSDVSDTINIKVIPTAGSITFHYYNQNGQPVAPDPGGQISGETSGKDFTNSGYTYSNDPTVNNKHVSNSHTEFGNTPTQNSSKGYYSRYGTYFDVKNIPVPNGYHIDSSSNQNMKRYYKFGREHQDVNVMVVGNQDDVANDPSQASDPTITSGDVDNNNDKHANVGSKSQNQHQNADTIWVTVHEMDPRNNQIRSYQIPSYISGNTGDQFHLYANNFTPEADQEHNYHFTPYSDNQINDANNNGSGKDNYDRADGKINSDGTVTAGEFSKTASGDINFTPQQTVNGNSLKTNNHVDFYYKVNNDDNNLKPINVTYMNGSTAVGFKQITPNSNDYDGEQIPSVIKDTNATQKSGDTDQGNITGDTTGDSVPSGYTPADSNNKYPATINDTQNQNIVIPVKRDTTHQNSVKYTVIDNFYEGSMGDRSHLVGTSSANDSSNAYNGQQITVSAASSATYAGATFNGDSTENSSAELTVASSEATPNVVNYNYYLNNAPTNPKSAGSQGTAVSGTAQPIYVQYFAGSNATDPTKSDDYLVGSDNKLTGKSGYTYSNVTNVAPVPAGYSVTSGQTFSHTISDQPYQMDIHLTKNAATDANFPLNIILTDNSGKPFDSYVQNIRVPNDQSKTISDGTYNPNSTDFANATTDSNNDHETSLTGNNFTVANHDGQMTQPNGTLIYKLNSQKPNDLGSINVTYTDVDTGEQVSGSHTISGNYVGQNMSDVTYSNGQTKGGTSTLPTGYSLVNGQNKSYRISNNTQNVNLLVKNGKNTGSNKVTVNVVEVNKNGSDVYLPNVATTSDTTIDPHDYIPESDYKTSSSSNKYGSNSTAYYVDPADRTQVIPSGKSGSVTFMYDQGHQNDHAGSIVLKYFNQYGQQVGTTDVINGKGSNYNRYGQTIDVTKTNNPGDTTGSTGEGIPDGYSWDSDVNQNTRYTFNNNQQNVDLFVKGAEQQTVLTIVLHKENKSDPTGTAPGDSSSISVPVNSPAGSTLSFDPDTYTPTGYQTASDASNIQHVKIGPNGKLSPGNINFYYVQNDIVLAKPYVIRYVNQNGQKVGYSDDITNPSLMNQTVNLTHTSDGGEPVPTGYTLASDTVNSTYGKQDVTKYHLGNNHTITLKVIGNKVTVPLTIYQVEQNSDNRPNDAVHTYTKQISITGHVGDSFPIDASQYVPSDYTVDPKNTGKTVTITSPNTLSINETESNKGRSKTDNQAVFYYNPATNEHPAPIHVYYIDNNSGNLVTQGYIKPTSSDKVNSVVNNVAQASSTNPGIPNGYQQVGNTIAAMYMHNPQNVYVPVESKQVTPTITIQRNILDNQGNKIAQNSVSDKFTAGMDSDVTYSPYDFIPTQGYGSLYATSSDNDQTVHITGNNHYTITWNYQQNGTAAGVQLGTINVHYVTAKPNNVNSNPVFSKGGTKYYQVDQESDHGFNGDTFNLTDYLNDIPSYQGNYYHLDTGSSNNQSKAVVGYNNIDGTQITSIPNNFTFNTSTTTTNSHQIYGDSTYAVKDPNNQRNALDTQDIYVLVAPNNSNPNGSYPNNQGNDAGGDENPDGKSTNNGSNLNTNGSSSSQHN